MRDSARLITSGCLAGLMAVSAYTAPVQAEPAKKMLDGFRVHLNWSFPRVDENWDGGLGLMAQALIPITVGEHTNKYHIGVTLGTSTWDANEDTVAINAGNASGGSGYLSGDMRSVMLGGSILRSDALKNGVTVTTEIGLLYNSVSSDTNINVTYSSSATTSAELDVDDAVLGLFALDFNKKVSENLSIFGGGGYQFDLGAGDASAFGDEETNYNNAVFLRAGLTF